MHAGRLGDKTGRGVFEYPASQFPDGLGGGAP
jgi:3-hydroxyacyl-CoA dehydrogenase